jgi:hypothetical protein
LTPNSRSYLNRWTQPDSIVPDLSNPQSLNRYSYVINSPLNNTDPTGHDICDEDGYCYSNAKGKYRALVRSDFGANSNITQSTNLAASLDASHTSESQPPTIPADPTIKASQGDSYTVNTQLTSQTDSKIITPLPNKQTGLQRLVEIVAGFYLVGEGLGVMGLGGTIAVTALVELVEGTATGPFAPLVTAHAGVALTVGGMMGAIGAGITVVGGYLIYEGITGKNPWGKHP